jgi:group II intron reverse transcriptase/maturase
MCGIFLRENREIPPSLAGDDTPAGRIGKAGGHEPMKHDGGKSDRPIVPTKLPNKAGPTAAEAVEGRGLTEGNTDEQNAPRTQRRTSAPSALDRVREVAKKDRKAKFTALFHHVTVERLRDAYLALSRGAAAGVDGVTWQQYGDGLEENLLDLHARLHRGAYRAKPSRRVYIPKADGRQRPLGIASLEDKVVQRAVVEVLNCIYETDFLGFSYGFRPGRGQHNALDALAVAIRHKRVNYVLDADIRGYFDSIDHGWMLKFFEHRIADRRMLRLIQKWLSAGVLQDGKWTASEEGTPQGATVSPLAANVYLHYVLDLWVQQWRTRHAHGDVIIVRYADDFLVGFEHRADAEQFHRELRERLAKFSLELHAEKTRLVEFGRFAASNRNERDLGKPETFNFLGFTHVCGKTRSGRFMVRRQTMRKRMTAKLHEVKAELQRRLHDPVPEQGKWLGSVVRGHTAYYAVPGNSVAVRAFRTQVARHWQRALRQRSQKHHVTWQRMSRLVERWLPPARTMHSFPEERLRVITRGKSPVR